MITLESSLWRQTGTRNVSSVSGFASPPNPVVSSFLEQMDSTSLRCLLALYVVTHVCLGPVPNVRLTELNVTQMEFGLMRLNNFAVKDG